MEADPTWPEMRPWLVFAMLYAMGCALLALRQAFASEYILADDVREHVFWMFRFIDPRLFPHDPIADYFQSLAPSGYAALYWLLARIGIDPSTGSKIIPTLLSLIAIGYSYLLASRVLRSPAAAALAAILFCQCLWLNSDLCSATPRAFFYPLFVAFLYYHVRDSMIGVLVGVGLEALFFPPAALLSLGVLGLDCVRWGNGLNLVSARSRRSYLFFATAFSLTLLCFWPYLHSVNAFGPLVTYAEARRMPEFGPGGRVPFFFPSLWSYWIAGNGGLHLPPAHPPWLYAGFFWPVLRRFPDQFPLLNVVPRGARPLPQIALAALALFALAHLFLFRLYLPNRYTEAPARVLLVLTAGGVMLALVDAALRWAERRSDKCLLASALTAFGFASVLLGVVAGFPLLLRTFPNGSYIKGTDPALYHFFSLQPATICIASLSEEANNLPTFCRRSILVGAECAVPFHPGYYLPLRDRGLQLARAQYSADLAVLQQCLRGQQIDFWLLDRDAFSRNYAHENRLLRQLNRSLTGQAIGLVQGATPLLERPPPESIVFEDAHFLVLDAPRLLALPTY